MAEYYQQRARAGLIITDGTAPCANGLGYPRIPGAYSDAQVEGWRNVVAAVHDAGGRIFLQLMHVGRVGHPHNLPDGAELVAPSALTAPGEMYTDQAGPQPHPEPRAMTESDIEQAVGEFAHAAKRAIEAGFDGVEIHGANGYLVEHEQYAALAGALDETGLAYVHTVDHSAMGAPEVPASIKRIIRERFSRTAILSGGYDRARAESDLAEGLGDLIAFGRPYIANPDLVERFRTESPLAAPNPDLFYTPGPEGYTDYPSLAGDKTQS